MLAALNLMKSPSSAREQGAIPRGTPFLLTTAEASVATGEYPRGTAGVSPNGKRRVWRREAAARLPGGQGPRVRAERRGHSLAGDAVFEARSRLYIPRPKVAANSLRELGSNLSWVTGAAGRPLAARNQL